SFSIASRCSLKFCMVGASKIFAPDSGRSKISRQIPSSLISRRIIGAVAVAVIGLILAGFSEIPSGMRWSNGVVEQWARLINQNLRAAATSLLHSSAAGERLRFAKANATKLGGALLIILFRHSSWSGKSFNRKFGA